MVVVVVAAALAARMAVTPVAPEIHRTLLQAIRPATLPEPPRGTRPGIHRAATGRPPRRAADQLHGAHVFAARTLGALTAVERDGLSFAHIVEPRIAARGVVEEVFVAVIRESV